MMSTKLVDLKNYISLRLSWNYSNGIQLHRTLVLPLLIISLFIILKTLYFFLSFSKHTTLKLTSILLYIFWTTGSGCLEKYSWGTPFSSHGSVDHLQLLASTKFFMVLGGWVFPWTVRCAIKEDLNPVDTMRQKISHHPTNNCKENITYCAMYSNNKFYHVKLFHRKCWIPHTRFYSENSKRSTKLPNILVS